MIDRLEASKQGPRWCEVEQCKCFVWAEVEQWKLLHRWMATNIWQFCSLRVRVALSIHKAKTQLCLPAPKASGLYSRLVWRLILCRVKISRDIACSRKKFWFKIHSRKKTFYEILILIVGVAFNWMTIKCILSLIKPVISLHTIIREDFINFEDSTF